MMVVIFGFLVRNECKENKDKMFFFFQKTKLNARLAIRQRDYLFVANIVG